jgi:glycosyltransferase involved in cell wall biosynthesis
MPTVSVMMPVYNAERYLAEAVESILGQTFADLEFLIVDDGSTDRSGAMLERYAARDQRMRGGTVAAWGDRRGAQPRVEWGARRVLRRDGR